MAIDLEFSFHTLNENYRELKKWEEKYFKNRQSVTYQDFGNWNKFILQLTRLLHNYLAAYSSFIDCMRTPRKKLAFKDPDFEREFAQKIEQIGEKAQFIKELRNFSQHKKLPIVSFRLTIVYLKGNESVKPDQLFKDPPSLRVDALLAWDGWTSFPKKFLLEQSTNELVIIPLITECQKAEEELYNWILQKITEKKIIKSNNSLQA